MTKKQLPVVITINQQKGGTGKSTITKNLSSYYAIEENAKVLVIDGDSNGYLTQLFGDKYIRSTGNIGELLKPKNINTDQQNNVKLDFVKVHKNIDLIPFDPYLDKKQNVLLTHQNINYIMLRWFALNKEMLRQYDYIFIDTHNDFNVFTKIAISISHLVLSPLDPVLNYEKAQWKMNHEFNNIFTEITNQITGESFVQAELYVIGNKVRHNTNRDKEFLNYIQNMDNYLTWFPNKELFALASNEIISMKDMINKDKNKHKHENFYAQYKEAIQEIDKIIKSK
ncbi:ParA family protein [Staphylococcus cohnii]|uniref:ParA family protein n=1 Tax=Staphylococcus cohnii TaxID=29382 RepID=UPI003AF5DAE8